MLSLALPKGVPQVSVLGPDLFTTLFAGRATPITEIGQQWTWAGSLATEHISGLPPLSPIDRRERLRLHSSEPLVYSGEKAIFVRGSARVHAERSPAICSVPCIIDKSLKLVSDTPW